MAGLAYVHARKHGVFVWRGFGRPANREFSLDEVKAEGRRRRGTFSSRWTRPRPYSRSGLGSTGHQNAATASCCNRGLCTRPARLERATYGFEVPGPNNGRWALLFMFSTIVNAVIPPPTPHDSRYLPHRSTLVWAIKRTLRSLAPLDSTADRGSADPCVKDTSEFLVVAKMEPRS